MADRLEQLVAEAAPAPRRGIDPDQLWRRGVRQRRTRAAGMGAAVVVVVAAFATFVRLPSTTNIDFAASPPRVQAVEAVLPEGGIVAEREVDRVGVRAVVDDDDLCVQIVTPVTRTVDDDPFADGAMGCAPVERLGDILAAEGIVSTASGAEGWRVFAGLTPDGFSTAISPDGRRWQVVDNLLVIVLDPEDAESASMGLPAMVDLVGVAGRRTVVVDDIDGAAREADKAVGDGCSGASPRRLRFVTPWAQTTTSLLEERCILPGRLAPAARFDTTDLGDEQPLDPFHISDGAGDVPDDSRLERGYPVLHLGSVELGSSGVHPVFVTWQRSGSPLVTACVDGSCGDSPDVGDPPGVLGIGGSGTTRVFDLWVPHGTSVVVVQVADVRVWQRPVARAAVLVVDLGVRDPDELAGGIPFRIRYLDPSGTPLREDSGALD